MAINRWRGDSQPVQQRTRYTVAGTVQVGDVLTLTRNLKEVTYTIQTGDDEALAAAGLAAAWEAATFPEAGESDAEYEDGDDFIDLVAAEPGVPFTVTASVTGAGPTTTLTASVITASAGPNHYDDADNWTGGIPDNTDDLVIDGGESLLYGGGTITFLTMDVRASFTNGIGLHRWNDAGYYEDRTREIVFDGATVYVGRGQGEGASHIYAKAIAASTWEVHATGNRAGDVPTLDIGATGNPTLVSVFGTSDVGILVEDETTARTIANVALSGEDARLTVGRRLTVTNLDHDNGTADVYGIVTNPTINRGTYNQFEGLYATMIAYTGAVVNLYHTGTSASTTGRGDGSGELGPVFNAEWNSLPRTWTASSMTGGAHLLDENKSVTLGGGTHTADPSFFANSRLGPTVNWSRT